MSHQNTTSQQDRDIAEAEASQHISTLVEIIGDLDEQLTAWKEASGCSSPDELKDNLRRMTPVVD